MCPFGFTHQPDACTHNRIYPTYLHVMDREPDNISTINRPAHPPGDHPVHLTPVFYNSLMIHSPGFSGNLLWLFPRHKLLKDIVREQVRSG
jgi:hypothetical protein